MTTKRNDLTSLVQDARAVIQSSTLYKRFIDGTPLANDLAVWMAEFALERIALERQAHPRSGEGATPLKDGNDGNTQQGNAGPLEGAERPTGVAGDARQPGISRARSAVAGWSRDYHSQTVGEGATPPQAEPGDEIARAKDAVMVAANKLTSMWGVAKANGWSQFEEAVDALIAAVRQR